MDGAIRTNVRRAVVADEILVKAEVDAAERDRVETGSRRPTIARALLAACVTALVLIGVATCGISGDAPSERVRADEFGEAWPLTVRSGLLSCEMGNEITFQVKGTEYTLTPPAGGTAYSEIAPIWASTADGRGRKDLGPLIERGRRLCR